MTSTDIAILLAQKCSFSNGKAVIASYVLQMWIITPQVEQCYITPCLNFSHSFSHPKINMCVSYFTFLPYIFFEIFGADTRIVSRWKIVDGAVKC